MLTLLLNILVELRMVVSDRASHPGLIVRIPVSFRIVCWTVFLQCSIRRSVFGEINNQEFRFASCKKIVWLSSMILDEHDAGIELTGSKRLLSHPLLRCDIWIGTFCWHI